MLPSTARSATDGRSVGVAEDRVQQAPDGRSLIAEAWSANTSVTGRAAPGASAAFAAIRYQCRTAFAASEPAAGR